MAPHDLRRPEARPDEGEARAPIEDLIRPGLLRAFPLPAPGGGEDERFRVLLDALARRTGDRR